MHLAGIGGLHTRDVHLVEDGACACSLCIFLVRIGLSLHRYNITATHAQSYNKIRSRFCPFAKLILNNWLRCASVVTIHRSGQPYNDR